MALNATDLTSPLGKLFLGTDNTAGYPTTAADAGTRWATIYRGYASHATAGTTLPVSGDITAAADVLATRLRDAFTAALAATPPHYPALVGAMVSAFDLFWPSVHFQTPPPPAAPTVTGVAKSPPAQQLTTDLTTFFVTGNPASGQGRDADTAAQSLATILNEWTKKVLVTNTPITGTPTTVQLA